jgi:hypothetical protein
MAPALIKQFVTNQVLLDGIMLEEITDNQKAIKNLTKVVKELLDHIHYLDKFISVSDAKVSIKSNHDLQITADGSIDLKAANNLSLKAIRINTDAQVP